MLDGHAILCMGFANQSQLALGPGSIIIQRVNHLQIGASQVGQLSSVATVAPLGHSLESVTE